MIPRLSNCVLSYLYAQAFIRSVPKFDILELTDAVLFFDIGLFDEILRMKRLDVLSLISNENYALGRI